jgi:hypothetical protein
MIKLKTILNEIQIDTTTQLLKLLVDNKEEISKIMKGYQSAFLEGDFEKYENNQVKLDFEYYDLFRVLFSFKKLDGNYKNLDINGKTIYWKLVSRETENPEEYD